MKLLNAVHESAVHSKRVKALERYLLPLMPQAGCVLDVGCGDGWLASRLASRLPMCEFFGIDVLAREDTHVPVEMFDGYQIPYDDNSFDAVMIVDVLHHTDDPAVLLREAKRVARKSIVLKDHTRDGWLANPTLRLMDWVGNAHHGVALPYNYLCESEWTELAAELELCIDHWNGELSLYGPPTDWLFSRSLHFVARLRVAQQSNAADDLEHSGSRVTNS